MSRVAINTGSIANDGTGDSLRIAGGKINDNFSELYNFLGDGTDLTPTWRKTAAGINTTSNVGIGTTNPRFALEVGAVGASGTSLHVNGNARVTGILTVGSSSIVLDGSANKILVGSGVSIDGNTGIISATAFYAGGSIISGGGGGSGLNYWGSSASGISTTGNVAIGTVTPTSRLTVVGNSLFSGIATFRSNLTLANLTSSSNTLRFGSNSYIDQSNSDVVTFQIDSGTNGTGTDSSFVFRTTQLGSPNQQFDALRVYSGGNHWNRLVRVYTNFHVDNNAFVGGDLQVGAASTLIGAGSTLGSFKVGTGGTVITTTSSGLVGVGITNPTSKLHVYGDVLVSGIITSNSFRARGGSPGSLGTSINGYGFSNPGDNDSGMYSSGDGELEFYSNAVEAMRINNSQNVGIGTTNPTSRLTVKGTSALENLTVSGISTFSNNVRVSGIVTASSILVSNDGGNNGSVLIQDTGAYSVITFRSSTGTDQTRIEGIEGNLYLIPGSSGAITLGGYTTNVFYNGGNVVLNNGAQGTTFLANGLGVAGLTTTTSLQVGTGGTVITTTSSGLVGIGTTNPISALTVKGDVNVSGVVTATSFSGSGSNLTSLPAGQLTGALPAIDGSALTGVVGSGSGVVIKDSGSTVGTAGTIDFGDNLSVSAISAGIVTVTASSGGGGSSQWVTTAAGIHTLSNVGIGTTNPTSALTVKGNTSLETLNVSGVSTFSGTINAGTGGILFDTGSYTGSDEPIKLWVGNSGGSRYFTLTRSNGGQVIFNNAYPTTGHNDHRAPTHSFTQTNGSDYYALFYNGSVKLYHPASASGILDQKLETIGAGVTVTGTTFTNQLSVSGGANVSGVVTASSFSGSNTLKTRTTVSGVTTSIANNGIGNTNITGFKSYALLKVGLSTAGWLRLYTDSASRTADASRSIGIDPTPGSGVIAEVITTGISTNQIITPFVMGGNLDNPADTTIYAAITNLSGVTTSISTNLTILQLEA